MTLLSTSLSIEPSQLYVADIADMTKFYRDMVGLEVLESSKTRALLGRDNVGVIELISKPKLAHGNPRDAGLFHNAILFDSRGELARSAGNVLLARPDLFTGTADHLVSEAFYFNDPEGNGLELYFDQPSDTWKWVNGQITMDTLYVDPIQYLQTHGSTYDKKDLKLGHVHLRVGDISQARQFYVNTLGFDITAMMPGALFVSVAGYHHHIALNTWMSEGAGKRVMTLGLSDIVIHLDEVEDLAKLEKRIQEAKLKYTEKSGALRVSDPWGNKLTFTAP